MSISYVETLYIHVKYTFLLFLPDINKTRIFWTNSRKSTFFEKQISNFIKILTVGTGCSMRTDRRTWQSQSVTECRGTSVRIPPFGDVMLKFGSEINYPPCIPRLQANSGINLKLDNASFFPQQLQLSVHYPLYITFLGCWYRSDQRNTHKIYSYFNCHNVCPLLSARVKTAGA